MGNVPRQQDPKPYHDCTDHGFKKNENGVCKVCGWWDPNGDICPDCGKPWSQHQEGDQIAVVIIFPQDSRARKAHLN